MMTVVPLISRNSRCTASSVSRCWIAMPLGRPLTEAYFSGSSVTMVIFTAPSARMLCAICTTL
ncbi:hypothetical protein Y695_04148 [Hydrogenophaga sp. T4]|nr:hypothetical protein Y695_04148 [Hydrogenophaga sp. T4]